MSCVIAVVARAVVVTMRIAVFFLFCVRFAVLNEFDEFSENQSSMTGDYRQILFVS